MSHRYRDGKPYLWDLPPIGERSGEYDTDGEYEARCTVQGCRSRITIDPSDGTEYGHQPGCPHRPDSLERSGDGISGINTALVCPTCGRGDFDSAKALQSHVGRAHDHSCPTCGAEHSTADALDRHLADAHPVSCPDCDGQFDSDDALYAHRCQVHLDDAAQCQTCHAWFTTVQGLRSHVGKSHDHACAECGAEHDSEADLDTHKARVHGSDPRQCPACEKWCPSKQSWVNHIRAVHGHACRACGAEFDAEHDLRRHELLEHDGAEDVVDCPACGKPFETRQSMRMHHYHAHGERLITEVECANDDCDELFEKGRVRDSYCSESCANNGKVVDRVEKHCAVCGDPFEVLPSETEKVVTCGDDECHSEHRRRRFEETCIDCGTTFRNSFGTTDCERCWSCRDGTHAPPDAADSGGVAGD